MAEYENLTTLEGLQVGDTVKYTATSQASFDKWNLDTKKYKFNIVMNGGNTDSSRSPVLGGKTIADIDCKNISNITLYFYSMSPGLAYGTYTTYADLLNYRLLVAGAAGRYTGNGFNHTYTATGGGINGTAATGDYVNGGGGSQTSGGSATKSGKFDSALANNGRFGYGASGSFNLAGRYTGSVYGGAGWYGGGASIDGSGVNSQPNGAAGGGSGFIIGKTTTTYPSGYLGDNTALQSSLASAISNASTTEAGSADENTIILTILALPGTDIGNSIKYYTNGAWKDATMKVYTNGVWKSASPKVYKESSWK
nr:MAG TPA: Glycine rich protein [Caudoviricetes sp.]